MPETLISRIHKFMPCADGVKWLADCTNLDEAWASCPRGDWMLWAAAKLDVSRPLVVRAACACARTALRFVPVDDDRPRLAIEAAEAWVENPTEENAEKVKAAAAYAAYAAAAASAYYAAASAYSAYSAASAYAAASAYYAAASAYSAYSAYASAYSASAAYAAYYADTDITLVDVQRQMASIVRQHIPADILRGAIRGK
jgi:hypothetical protein